MNKEPERDEILQAASHGNAAALEFLRVFARRAHWVDDLADRDTSKSGRADGSLGMTALGPAPSDLAEFEAEWLLCLSANPFFLAHRAQLVPAMVLALNAWVDSEAMRSAAADVVKGQWHEVVWLVAWLTGGWTKLRDVSGQFRSYDFEPADDLRVDLRKEANGLPR